MSEMLTSSKARTSIIRAKNHSDSSLEDDHHSGSTSLAVVGKANDQQPTKTPPAHFSQFLAKPTMANTLIPSNGEKRRHPPIEVEKNAPPDEDRKNNGNYLNEKTASFPVPNKPRRENGLEAPPGMKDPTPVSDGSSDDNTNNVIMNMNGSAQHSKPSSSENPTSVAKQHVQPIASTSTESPGTASVDDIRRIATHGEDPLFPSALRDSEPFPDLSAPDLDGKSTDISVHNHIQGTSNVTIDDFDPLIVDIGRSSAPQDDHDDERSWHTEDMYHGRILEVTDEDTEKAHALSNGQKRHDSLGLTFERSGYYDKEKKKVKPTPRKRRRRTGSGIELLTEEKDLQELALVFETSLSRNGGRHDWDYILKSSSPRALKLIRPKIDDVQFRRNPLGHIVAQSKRSRFRALREVVRRSVGEGLGVDSSTNENNGASRFVSPPTGLARGRKRARVRARTKTPVLKELAWLMVNSKHFNEDKIVWSEIKARASPEMTAWIKKKEEKDPLCLQATEDSLVPKTHLYVFRGYLSRMERTVKDGRVPASFSPWNSSRYRSQPVAECAPPPTNRVVTELTKEQTEFAWLREESRFATYYGDRRVRWDFVVGHSSGTLRQRLLEEVEKPRWEGGHTNKVIYVVPVKARGAFYTFSEDIFKRLSKGYRRPHMVQFMDLESTDVGDVDVVQAEGASEPSSSSSSLRQPVRKKFIPKQIHKVGDKVMACMTEAVDDDEWLMARVRYVLLRFENGFHVRYYSLVFEEEGDNLHDSIHEAFVKTPEDYNWLDQHSETELKGVIRCTDPRARDKYNRLRGWYETAVTGPEVFTSVSDAMRAYDDACVKRDGAGTSPSSLNLPTEWNFDTDGVPVRKHLLLNSKSENDTEQTTPPSAFHENEIQDEAPSKPEKPVDSTDKMSNTEAPMQESAEKESSKSCSDQNGDMNGPQPVHDVAEAAVPVEVMNEEQPAAEQPAPAPDVSSAASATEPSAAPLGAVQVSPRSCAPSEPPHELKTPPPTASWMHSETRDQTPSDDNNKRSLASGVMADEPKVDGPKAPENGTKSWKRRRKDSPASLDRTPRRGRRSRELSNTSRTSGLNKYVSLLQGFESRRSERWEDFQRRLLDERSEFCDLNNDEQKSSWLRFVDSQQSRWEIFVSEELALLDANTERITSMSTSGDSIDCFAWGYIERHVDRRLERLEDCCRRLQQDADDFLSAARETRWDEWDRFVEIQNERWRDFKHSEQTVMQQHINHWKGHEAKG